MVFEKHGVPASPLGLSGGAVFRGANSRSIVPLRDVTHDISELEAIWGRVVEKAHLT